MLNFMLFIIGALFGYKPRNKRQPESANDREVRLMVQGMPNGWDPNCEYELRKRGLGGP